MDSKYAVGKPTDLADHLIGHIYDHCDQLNALKMIRPNVV